MGPCCLEFGLPNSPNKSFREIRVVCFPREAAHVSQWWRGKGGGGGEKKTFARARSRRGPSRGVSDGKGGLMWVPGFL